METAKQWSRRVVVVTALLVASGTMLVWGQQRSNSPVSKADVKRVQENLRDKGYYDGQIDGIAGSRTEAGIRQYQKSENLPVTGRVDTQTANKLGQESVGGSFKGAGQEVGEGGKQAGHEMMKGKPVAAGKEMGKGFGRGGKKVGHGVKEAVSPESERGDQEKPEQPEIPQ